MNLRRAVPIAVLLLLLAGLGVAWRARSAGSSQDTPRVGASATSSPHDDPAEARAPAAAQRALPDPPAVDTAVEAKQDPCTMLALARQKVRVNEDMLAITDDAEAARQMKAVVATQNKAIIRHMARIERLGLACPGE